MSDQERKKNALKSLLVQALQNRFRGHDLGLPDHTPAVVGEAIGFTYAHYLKGERMHERMRRLDPTVYSAEQLAANLPGDLCVWLLPAIQGFLQEKQPNKAETMLSLINDKSIWCLGMAYVANFWAREKQFDAAARVLHKMVDEIALHRNTEVLSQDTASQHLATGNKIACWIGDLPLARRCISMITPDGFRWYEMIAAQVEFHHKLGWTYEAVEAYIVEAYPPNTHEVVANNL